MGYDLFGHVNRDSEPDADTSSGPGENSSIDSDHLSSAVQERPPAVPRINGGIGLDEILVWPGPDMSVLGADNANCYSVIKAKGVSHGNDPVAYFKFVGIAHGERAELLICFYTDKGQIGFGITAYDFCTEAPAACQLDVDFIGLLHNMIIGQNETIFINNKSRSEVSLLEALGHLVAEEPIKKVF